MAHSSIIFGSRKTAAPSLKGILEGAKTLGAVGAGGYAGYQNANYTNLEGFPKILSILGFAGEGLALRNPAVRKSIMANPGKSLAANAGLEGVLQVANIPTMSNRNTQAQIAALKQHTAIEAERWALEKQKLLTPPVAAQTAPPSTSGLDDAKIKALAMITKYGPAALIGGGVLAAGAIAANAFGHKKSPEVISVGSGGSASSAPAPGSQGKLHVTLPNKHPSDRDTTVELPLEQLDLPRRTIERIGIDTRRRLRLSENANIQHRKPKVDINKPTLLD